MLCFQGLGAFLNLSAADVKHPCTALLSAGTLNDPGSAHGRRVLAQDGGIETYLLDVLFKFPDVSTYESML